MMIKEAIAKVVEKVNLAEAKHDQKQLHGNLGKRG